jgi:cytochrome c oxidase cbb3-type subunit 2
MERFHSLVFVAGLGCFAVAFVLSMIFPWMSLTSFHGMDYRTLAELAERPSREFQELARDYPESFAAHYGEVSPESYGRALQRGRDVYVGQACWHCHSQYVRVVSNEHVRWGAPSSAQEYQNALNQPHLWGTRRVGPDLAREGGKKSNDWHVAHFVNPKSVVPHSVMPSYSSYFDERGVPDGDGMALIAYMQWLGTVQAGIPVADRVTP